MVLLDEFGVGLPMNMGMNVRRAGAHLILRSALTFRPIRTLCLSFQPFFATPFA